MVSKEHKRLWGMMELFYTLSVMVVIQLYAFVKTNRTLP